ncbi:hydantoinase B/oxoprolinase family protein [Pseudemcibacter aquimaris]|uniref:hydantoinase B/oxoprolinase family protein n=1 Tax=Pseudemcibacter aquimaris TaxID=2857064 RepID=UPI002010DC9C|nr:hydantoinase B/oxoprolinase family protein [Pseudemcibacter aquimaris]MCC3861386.1 hydantoinase B/oxoprolinase family protein [Pseudemcibacter aquimaris]WDU58156.1 hydantoinase B/oxoprolinase family protein [Pseudemcibacter aquimaris]
MDNKWQFWIDRGGTFTDVVARDPDGDIKTHKLLSENPDQYHDAALEAIRRLMGTSSNTPIKHSEIASVKMGTTVATNALLERKGDRTLLLITKGFRDALKIGYQARPRLFDLNVILPEQLYERVIEVEERIGPNGALITPLDVETVRPDLEQALKDGITSVAIVCMHGYRYTDHEAKLSHLAREVGFPQISTSHETSPLMKLVGRGDTTVVDAYLSPILRRYIDRVQSELGEVPLYFMQSNGGLAGADHFQGKDAILSGPAGGIVGAVKTAALSGYEKLIGFDMGGTSTDVSHYDGEYERSYETVVAGVRMRVPMMNIHTVAAGGGSILEFDGSRYRVGPDSAGAAPGPASYRNGGSLTVTDCNVQLGFINTDYFPKSFGPSANLPLNKDIVSEKFEILRDQINKSEEVENIAEGFLDIAIENMAAAIKKISTEKGYDVRDYTLVSFGGAGGQHACKIADNLGIKRIFLHPFAGVLSAFGMGLADLRSIREETLEISLNADVQTTLNEIHTRLLQETNASLAAQKVTDINHIAKAHIKYKGSDSTLEVDINSPDIMKSDFEIFHQQQFGFISTDKELIIEKIHVESYGGAGDVKLKIPQASNEFTKEKTKIFRHGKWQDATIIHRNDLGNHINDIKGPAIIREDHGTNYLELGWRAFNDDQNNLIFERVDEMERRHAIGTTVDPVQLEIFNNLFMSIAEQMGAVLENVAHSVNMKERLDFSCALFDGDGNLVANAPHMPVHLGSMGRSIKTVIDNRKDTMKRGDVYMLNDPYNGGTHLPDITIISPWFNDGDNNPSFYVATRGHHADIGGITPGSMPPMSKHIDEEGILFNDFLLMQDGKFLEQELKAALLLGPYPARNPEQNIADLKGQIAANEKGLNELTRISNHYGTETVLAYMDHVQNNAEEAVRRVIHKLSNAEYEYPFDNGAVIKVKVTIDQETRSATLDFTGTSAELDNNFNAPLAICHAAVLYVFRCMVDDDIPLNQGCLKPVKIIVPEKTFLNPSHPRAVVAGNVETSQAIVNCLFLAFGAMAASQGTMNNFTFGDDALQYYETVAGGMGATANGNGADAIQTHMTNSRLTDPEVLEWRYPVLLRNFKIRADSGGKGKHNGGNGVERRIEFLKNMQAAIISNNRLNAPMGLKGGQDAMCGENSILRENGTHETLSSSEETTMLKGDVFIIKTPGGGGYGKS